MELIVKLTYDIIVHDSPLKSSCVPFLPASPAFQNLLYIKQHVTISIFKRSSSTELCSTHELEYLNKFRSRKTNSLQLLEVYFKNVSLAGGEQMLRPNTGAYYDISRRENFVVYRLNIFGGW